jgi:hypothetical protein
MRVIRASEIGAYLYCRRAWWYQKTGVPSQNLADLAAGTELHYRHGRAVLRLGLVRMAAYALLLLALVLVALYFTNFVL